MTDFLKYIRWVYTKESSLADKAFISFCLFNISWMSVLLCFGVYEAINTWGEPIVRAYTVQIDDENLSKLFEELQRAHQKDTDQ